MVVFKIAGEAGGSRTLKREGGLWRLYARESDNADCEVRMDQDTA